MLDLLAAHPADVHVADVLTRFAGTTNFRKLEPGVQRTLLNLVKRYAGKGLRL